MTVQRGGDGGGVGDLPNTGPYTSQNPREANPATTNRLATSPGDTKLTVHPMQGVVPVLFGPADIYRRRGGRPTYHKKIGTYHYFVMDMGEGPLGDIRSVKFGDKPAGAVNCAVEFHTGGPGDTTSTMINAFEPTWNNDPETAFVAIRCPLPTQTTGPWSPFDFTCETTGIQLYNPLTAATEVNGFPASAAYALLTNDVYGIGEDVNDVDATDYAAFEQYCETDIGGGVLRWQFSLLCDQQDTADSWLRTILSYGVGHTRFSGDGQFGVWYDAPRACDVDSAVREIVFNDRDPDSRSCSGWITWVGKGSDERPTVCIVDGNDNSAPTGEFISTSVQVPDPLSGGIDWRELRFSMPGFYTMEILRRYATLQYNIAQQYKDITIPATDYGLLVVPGDRVRTASDLLLAATDTPPNSDSIEGFEDVLITDVTSGPNPVCRGSLYREDVYGELIDDSGPPVPPDPPPDPDDDPPCPLSLDAPHSDPSEYGMVILEPDDESIISYYEIHDLFGGGDTVAGYINPPFDPPISGDGKYHKSFASLVHYDGSGAHLDVRAVPISYAGNPGVGCGSTSWDEPVAATSTAIESASYTFAATAVPTSSYAWPNYTKVTDVTKKHATTIDDVVNDYFVVTTGNAQGIFCPKMDGMFLVSATAYWDNASDSTYRALSLAVLNLAGGVGLHTLSFTIDAAGTGYLTGETFAGSGGTLASGGFVPSGVIIASGGAVTGIIVTNPGIGYSAVPTITITTVGGSGATITAHLPAAFTFADLNFDCTQDPDGFAKGAIWFEDIKPACSDTDALSSVHAQGMISMHKGDGIMMGLMQGTGGNLDLHDDTGEVVVNPRFARVSIFRVPPASPLAEQFAQCPAPG